MDAAKRAELERDAAMMARERPIPASELNERRRELLARLETADRATVRERMILALESGELRRALRVRMEADRLDETH